MALSVNRVTNANIYLNGNNLLGRAEEIELPDIKHKFSDHKALGMVGSPEFFAGIDKLMAKIKWNSFYRDTFVAVSNPTQSVALQCRSSLETFVSGSRTAETPCVCYLTGFFKNAPMGNFKQHDNVELSTEMSVTYVKLEIGGVPVIEVDVLANIYKVDGQDILAQYRANLGA